MPQAFVVAEFSFPAFAGRKLKFFFYPLTEVDISRENYLIFSQYITLRSLVEFGLLSKGSVGANMSLFHIVLMIFIVFLVNI